MEENQVRELLVPLLKRSQDSQKYNFGHVLVIGGSPGMIGAPLMSASAALRTGAGLVTVASTMADAMQGRILEVMTLRLSENSEEAGNQILDFIAKRSVRVVIVGPGLSPESAPFVNHVLTQISLPVVLDAGGFTNYVNNLSALTTITGNNPSLILTPHLGEFARLTNTPLLTEHPVIKSQAEAFAKQYSLTLVLKGSRTVVATVNGTSYENKTGNPGLATAGTGDVLTGMIAALCGQGLNAFTSSAAGVYLHGIAGDIAVNAKTEPGLIATDVIKKIPVALKALINS